MQGLALELKLECEMRLGRLLFLHRRSPGKKVTGNPAPPAHPDASIEYSAAAPAGDVPFELTGALCFMGSHVMDRQPGTWLGWTAD
jgi:hypothetical protein